MNQWFYFSVIPPEAPAQAAQGAQLLCRQGGITQDIPASSNGAHYLPSPHKNNSPPCVPFSVNITTYLSWRLLTWPLIIVVISASTLLFRVSTCRGLDNGLQCPPRASWSLNPVGDVQSLACLTSHLQLKKPQLSKHRSFRHYYTILFHASDLPGHILGSLWPAIP